MRFKDFKKIYSEDCSSMIKESIKNILVEYIAEISMKDKTGARSLKGTFAKVMTDYMYNAPSKKKKRYVINKDCCEKVLT